MNKLVGNIEKKSQKAKEKQNNRAIASFNGVTNDKSQ